jgi:uncharacterized protein YdeI (YjbR/CyaY-like superfamily)
MSERRPRDLLELPDRTALHAWLERHHATSPGVHLAVSRKGGTRTSLTYEEAVLEGLAFGWIDSTAHRLDEGRMSILFTPRKPTSTWSRSNKLRVERLLGQGLMQPAGVAAVERAKANGSWTLLDDVEDLKLPEDLAAGIAASGVSGAWESASASQRKMALHWIASARRPETRERRIASVIEAACEGRPLR